MKTLVPPRLRPNDLVGLVSPAGNVEDSSRIENAVRYLEKLGFRVRVAAHAARVHGYLAGTDRERAEDLHAMFADARVRAVFCLRGGYGATRLLPLLDYRLIARHPKIFVGYSDITALLLAFWKKCRLVTFHGPMAAVDWGSGAEPDDEGFFWELLSSPLRRRAIPVKAAGRIHRCGGRATGRLLGGNLSLVASLAGTPFMPDFTRCILFLEEVNEEPYRVDRMLIQLRNSAVLRRSSGFLLGQFSRCLPQDPSRPSLNIPEILDEIIAPLRKPLLLNLPFGHLGQKLTLPVGVRAAVDAEKRELALQESPVG